jgi:hypothetical protein
VLGTDLAGIVPDDKAQIRLNVERQEGKQVVETSIPINGLRHRQ